MPVSAKELPRILVAHPWMGRGGSEAVALWTLQALQDISRVTFITASPIDWDTLNGIYGTRIRPRQIEVRQVKGLPFVRNGELLVAWQRALFECRCRQISSDFDLCLSAYNPIDFKRPGIQLIGDFSFCEKARLLLYPNAEDLFCHRPSPLRSLYLSAQEFLRGWRRSPLSKRGDCVVANSFWTAERLERIFRIGAAPVLHPPVAMPDTPSLNETTRDPFGFVCLGRISPEKEIETIIAILDRVRSAGYPVTLNLVGQFGTDPYSERISQLVETRRQWIRTPGFLGPEEKSALFASQSFCIHACRVEAFGIAVAEMAASGLIPLVPFDGATREIAMSNDLVYAGGSDAVRKITALLEATEQHNSLRQELKRHNDQFRPEYFMRNLVRLVEEFMGRPLPNPPPSSETVTLPHVAKTLTTVG